MSALPDRRGSSAGAATAAKWRPQRALVLALLVSVVVHLALSLVPDEPPATPDAVPLTAELKELPPPPAVIAAAPKPAPKPRRKVAPPPAPTPVVEPVAAAEELLPEPAPEAAPAVAGAEASPDAPQPVAEAPPPVLAEDVEPAPSSAPIERKTLPPRVDLAYKVFYGTQGFLIGQATYRFEHADNRYRIGIVGDARGLAALLFRGQGRVESRGLITPEGLQPHELIVDKFNKRGSERAEFDWENGIANLHDNKTAALELPTYDLLALMWQFYFQPPDTGVQTFSLATTKRIYKVTATRIRNETIEWAQGPVDTEVWHRTSEDGKTEGYVWVAPSLRWLPVKVRAETPRGTVEVLLEAIRVDESQVSAAQTG